MEVLRRVLVGLGGLLSLAVALLVAIGFVNRGFSATVLDFLDHSFLYTMQVIFIDGVRVWPAIVCGVAAILVSALLIFIACYKERPQRRMEVTASDGFVVEISQEAIDNVVRRAATNVAQVCGLASKLTIKEDKLYIDLNIVVPAEEAIPDIGAAVRAEVFTQMEAMTSIVPQDIRIRVTKVVEKQEGQARGNR